jgi:hypothetical protein
VFLHGPAGDADDPSDVPASLLEGFSTSHPLAMEHYGGVDNRPYRRR